MLAIFVAVLGGAYHFWIRDLPWFAVEDVAVSGLDQTAQADEIRSALESGATGMTTLHVDEAALKAAVDAYPAVVGLEVTTDFPHVMSITVRARRPVAVVRNRADGSLHQVAADGTLLATVPESGELPMVAVESLPGSGRLIGPALAIAQVAGATPSELREVVEDVRWDEDLEGVEVMLAGDIAVRFGDGGRAAAKWAAAAAILADPQVVALTYLDVSVPERPALGGNA